MKQDPELGEPFADYPAPPEPRAVLTSPAVSKPAAAPAAEGIPRPSSEDMAHVHLLLAQLLGGAPAALNMHPTTIAGMQQLTTPYAEVVHHEEGVARACEALERRGSIAITAVTSPDNNKLDYLAVGAAEKTVIFDLRGRGLPDPLRALIEGPIVKIIHGLDRTARTLLACANVELDGVEDLYAASVLSDGFVRPRDGENHGLPALVARQLRRSLPGGDGVASPARCASDVAAMVSLYQPLRAAVASANVHRAWELENDLVGPVAAIETSGFWLDIDRTKTVLDRARHAANDARGRLAVVLGDVNLDSQDELRAALGKTCDFAFSSTAQLHLRRLVKDHPFLLELLKYRKAAMYAQHAEAWLAAVSVDGRVHPTFESLAAATGRMSCSDPPLHSVPHRPDVRECFVAAPGCKLIIADYSAIELAIIADRVGDEEMQRCLREGIDLHRRTAGHLLKAQIGDVTEEQRRRVKPVNFGVVYGMGIDTLIEYAEENYGIVYTPADAKRMRSAFFHLYQGVGSWHQQVKNDLPKTTEIRSASGRLRRFSEPKVTELLNTPIQGTGADGFKRAVVLAHRAVAQLGGRLVHLQHDEIVAEAPDAAAEAAAEAVKQAMIEGMVEFVTKVPIGVKVTIGDAWARP